MRMPETGTLSDSIEGLLAGHATEIAARDLRVRTELDPQWTRDATPASVEAFRKLLRLVFATVPDGCEVYVASARSTAPVARLGAGQVTARWQVEGASERAGDQVSSLHPRPGSAWAHARSPLARRIREAFARAGWVFELEARTSGDELLARARIDLASES